MGSSAEETARSLTYMQRKALRRRGRGGSLTRTMAADPLIVRISDYSRLEPPPDSADVLAWIDWEGRARRQHPVLNSEGLDVLAALERRASK